MRRLYPRLLFQLSISVTNSGATVLLVMRCHNSRFLGYVTGEEVYGEGVPCSLLAPGAVGAGNGLILVIRVFHGLANY